MMNIKPSLFFILVLIATGYSQLLAQNKVQSTIEYTIVEVTPDKLSIRYDLNSPQPANKVWVEIFDGSKLLNPTTISGDLGQNIVPGKNKTIVWDIKKDGFDLTNHQMSITVKANVAYQPVEPVQAQLPIPEKKEEPKEPAVYPLFRTGIEIAVLDGSGSNFVSNEFGITFEYIAKPWWSILSGVEYQMAEYRSDFINYSDFGTDSWNYKSIIIPITAELKLNAGRWFRLFGGGGIENRITIIEGDPALNINAGLNRYMIGLKLEAGIEIRNIRIGGKLYRDLNSYSVFDEQLSVMGFMVNWRFGGSKAYIKN